MDLPSVEEANIRSKRILLRLDTDVPVKNGGVADDTRLRVSIPTINYLVNQGCAGIVMLGHRGRPIGTEDSLSLSIVADHLEKLLIKDFGKEKVKKLDIFMMENLRFNPAEMSPLTKAGEEFAKELTHHGEIFVNDAFGVCHREQVSTTGLPKILPHFAGLHLIEEVEKLSKVLQNPRKPVVFVLGGGKEDKAILVPKILDHTEWLLVGGVLPKRIDSYCRDDGHICVSAAKLTNDGKDITPDSARNFEEIIKDAGTIVWNGPMGDIDSGFWGGTEVIAKAITESNAYKVVGGGDTIKVIKKFGLQDKFDHISTGGGAMLEFLAYGDLPGLRALRK